MKGKSSRKARKPSTFKLQFCTADFYVEKSDGGYDVIKIKGGSLTTQIGWPELPITTKHFVLPTHATKITLKVEKQKWVRLPGRFSLAPAQLPRPAIKNPPPGDDRLIHFRQGPNFRPKNGRPGRLPLPPIPAWGGLEYQANEVFVPLAPDAAKAELISYPTAEIASISQVGGRPVVSVLFHPLRYRPRTGIVEVLSQAQLQISHSYDQAGIIDGQLSEAALAQDMQKLISLVENPGDIKFEFPNLEGLEDLPPFCPDEPGFEPEFPKRFPKKYPVIIDDRIFIPPDVLFIPREQDWPYLIITDDYEWNENGTKGSHIGNLIEEFERLARWKTMKGVRTRVISISDIVANTFGTHWKAGITRDLPEAIRNFLKYAFTYWNTRWCLIGGDINIVPTRHILANNGHYHIAKKTDLSPGINVMFYDSATPALRFQSSFDFTTDDVFFSVNTGEVIRYNAADATTASPGWYWTQNDDYATKSSLPTRFIVIRGPTSLLTQTFAVPQYPIMVPSDFYYSSVDSPLYSLPDRHDWDNDNNGIYGWYDSGNPDGVDFAADISVGRAPVNSAQSTIDFVDKVLSYELFRDVRADGPLDADYVRKLCGVGAVWGSSWWDGSFERLRWGGLDGACQDKEKVIAKFRDMGINTDLIQRVYEDIYFVPRIESNLIVLDQSHISQRWRLINDGPHFLSVSGHGCWDGCSGFSSTDPSWVNVQGMNNWPHFAIYFVDSCLTNEFDLTHWTAYNRNGGAQAGDRNAVCFGKHVVRHGGGGAIGYLGYTRVGFVGRSREIEFWESLSLYGQAHLGKMQDRAREICKNYSSYQAFIMTLMGDPELPIYTQPPKALTVSHTAFVYGRDKLTVSVYHQELAKTDCTVTVCQMSETDSTDKRFFRLVGATEGHYTFNTSDARDGDIYVTVTAKNFVPYTGRVVKVSQPVSPWKYRTNGFVYDLVVRGDSDSSIYAASGDTKLYALSPTMGLIWMRDLDGIVQDLDAAKDGSVLVGLRSNVSQNLLLFDKNGNRLHSWNVADEVFCIAYDPHRNTACAGLSNLNSRNSSLRTYDTSTGALRWTRNDLGSCRHVGLDSSGNIYACVTKDNPKIVKLSSDTGGTIWSYDIGASWEWESLALLVEPSGICYVSTRNHELHKVDSTGSQVWKKTGGADPNNISTAVHSLVKSGTRLYAGAGDGIIHAIEPDGTIVWKCDTGDRVDCLDVGRNDTVYAGCWHGICAISSAGTSLWFREVTGGVLSLVRVNDKLFGGSRDGWVYQVDVDESIRLSDLVVDDDVVRLHGLVISGGATHMMEFADLKKVLGVKLQTKTSEK